MKALAFFLFATPCVCGATLTAPEYPGCDIKNQRLLRAEMGGAISDPRQAHISVRANILQADISNARKARHLTQPEADKLWQRVDVVRGNTDSFVQTQGFLSAGERASYDRELDDVAKALCK